MAPKCRRHCGSNSKQSFVGNSEQNSMTRSSSLQKPQCDQLCTSDACVLEPSRRLPAPLLPKSRRWTSDSSSSKGSPLDNGSRPRLRRRKKQLPMTLAATPRARARIVKLGDASTAVSAAASGARRAAGRVAGACWQIDLSARQDGRGGHDGPMPQRDPERRSLIVPSESFV